VVGGDQDPPRDDGATVEKASAALGAGLALFTASLGAIGGLTGGIARMFRNSDGLSILLAFALVLGSVVIAVAARLMRRTAAIASLAIAMVTFGTGTFLAIAQMVESAQTEDRPTLTAQLVAAGGSGWLIKVQASSSGLSATEQLLVLVYAQPKRSVIQPSPSTDSSAAATRSGRPAPTARPSVPSPTPSVVAAGRLAGDRLLFAQAGRTRTELPPRISRCRSRPMWRTRRSS
jgi:hypothetical protein